ncbi:integrase family protein [Leptospira sp. 96542]|nr:integrase family protein [Leptospira sp. 96542]
MYFDARTAKLLKPGEHLVVDGCQGLRLVATASTKTWTYRFKLDERMKQTALGQWPAMSVQAAVGAWQALRDLRAEGGDPAAQKKARRRPEPSPSTGVRGDVYTVADVVSDFCIHLHDTRAEAGAVASQRALERVLAEEPEFAASTPQQVTRAVAFNLLDARKATPTAAAKLRSLFGAAWDHALDAGRVPDTAPNWWRQVMRGKLKSRGKIIGGEHVGRTRRVLNDAEVGTLLRWLPSMHDLAADATVLYLWTCARGGEILAMRPEHITEEADGVWWTVPKEQTKNARFENAGDHRVPLVGRALKIVKRRMASVGQSGFLFEDSRGEQYTQHDFSTYIYHLQPYSDKATARRAEGAVLPVTNWTPHNLRRTGRTMLSALGCIDEIGEAILGHLQTGIVGVYNTHRYDAEKRTWLTRLAKHLEQLAK